MSRAKHLKRRSRFLVHTREVRAIFSRSRNYNLWFLPLTLASLEKHLRRSRCDEKEIKARLWFLRIKTTLISLNIIQKTVRVHHLA